MDFFGVGEVFEGGEGEEAFGGLRGVRGRRRVEGEWGEDRERERERERERARERERERGGREIKRERDRVRDREERRDGVCVCGREGGAKSENGN